ncbi:hypothetical protein CVT26_013330 [Gymnopilus dilepis]|uniref:Fibronectin type-III domain-containing protein n=1 Tax=Gymnopilus dilepis TaxID=231916 RepID=A0A409YF35_9AGAR|nr:hypothetical protein CVT26_013330 [Gymnopilus dilepis]
MVQILLGEKAHLIEFPSILLPPGATTGSIVNISVHQNHAEEQKREREFWDLQDEILEEFGKESPEPPKLNVRNVTQTSVTLEWPPLKLAKAKIRSLDIYRNGQRLSSVPSPLTNTSTKHSGMDINTEYTFQLILRTTAGTFPSNILKVRTHTMQDTSGISVCFGTVQDEVLLENAKLALRDMGAKWSDRIQIDTSHFVCTTPAGPGGGGAPGAMYQRALQLSIPVVQPHWILACHAEKRMVPIASYYLGAASSTPSTAAFNRPQSMSQASLPRSPSSPQPNQSQTAGQRGQPASYRASMPPPSRSNLPPGTPPSSIQSAFVNQQQQPSSGSQPRQFGATPEEHEGDGEEVRLETQRPPLQSNGSSEKRKSRMGSMNREFKFPAGPVSPTSPTAPGPATTTGSSEGGESKRTPPPAHHAEPPASTPEDEGMSGPPPLPSQQVQAHSQSQSKRQSVINPANIEVPAPPPVEKERRREPSGDGEEDEGDEEEATVEISLN